ncbi:hypothetical protein [Paenibacillus sp. CMAA1364]
MLEAQMQLDVRPGLLTGTYVVSSDELSDHNSHEWSITTEVISSQMKQEIVTGLTENAHDVYGLLGGETPSWLQTLLPSPIRIFLGEATCTCGDVNCAYVVSMQSYASRQLDDNPLMMMSLLGLSRKELLSDIFRAWSTLKESKTKEIATMEASLTKEKEKQGPTPADWLAEAAEQGRLHDPGALYKDMTINLSPPDDSELHADDWTPLLEGVPGVQKALRLIIKKTADHAEKRRKTSFKE